MQISSNKNMQISSNKNILNKYKQYIIIIVVVVVILILALGLILLKPWKTDPSNSQEKNDLKEGAIKEPQQETDLKEQSKEKVINKRCVGVLAEGGIIKDDHTFKSLYFIMRLDNNKLSEIIEELKQIPTDKKIYLRFHDQNEEKYIDSSEALASEMINLLSDLKMDQDNALFFIMRNNNAINCAFGPINMMPSFCLFLKTSDKKSMNEIENLDKVSIYINE